MAAPLTLDQSVSIAARWKAETASLRDRAQHTFPGPLAVSTCLATTANLISAIEWRELLKSMAKVVNLTVVATPSQHVSAITHGHGKQRPHDLLPGEEWRSFHSLHVARLMAAGESALRGALVVRRSALRMPAWDEALSQQGPSNVWARTKGFSESTYRWADAEISLQGECYRSIVAAEDRITRQLRKESLANLPWSMAWLSRVSHVSAKKTVGANRFFQFDVLVMLRADMAFPPGMTLGTLVTHARAHMAPCTAPTVIIPDTLDGHGFNDRMAIMNRAAGPAYFLRGDLLDVSNSLNRPYIRRVRQSEELLKLALMRDRVQVVRSPTVGIVSCCSKTRSHCRADQQCFGICRRRETQTSALGEARQFPVLFGRIASEAVVASTNGLALSSGGRVHVMPPGACPTEQERLQRSRRDEQARWLADPDDALPCQMPGLWQQHMSRPRAYAFCVLPYPRALTTLDLHDFGKSLGKQSAGMMCFTSPRIPTSHGPPSSALRTLFSPARTLRFRPFCLPATQLSQVSNVHVSLLALHTTTARAGACENGVAWETLVGSLAATPR